MCVCVCGPISYSEHCAIIILLLSGLHCIQSSLLRVHDGERVSLLSTGVMSPSKHDDG